MSPITLLCTSGCHLVILREKSADLQQRKQCHSVGHWERKGLRNIECTLNTKNYETLWQMGHYYFRKHGGGAWLSGWHACWTSTGTSHKRLQGAYAVPLLRDGTLEARCWMASQSSQNGELQGQCKTLSPYSKDCRDGPHGEGLLPSLINHVWSLEHKWWRVKLRPTACWPPLGCVTTHTCACTWNKEQ